MATAAVYTTSQLRRSGATYAGVAEELACSVCALLHVTNKTRDGGPPRSSEPPPQLTKCVHALVTRAEG